MSIPAESETQRLQRFGWVTRLSPLLVAFILAALWMAGTPPEIPDLRLSAPIVARPGTSIGLRAWHLDRDDKGYTVIRSPSVTVDLRDESGALVGRVALDASLVHGAEGTLPIGSDLDGQMTLVARSTIDGNEVRVERTLHVLPGIDSRLPSGRSVNAFQAYELGRLQVGDPTRAPKRLDPRVEEGACVQGLRCSLLVWVGDWEGRVRLRPSAGIDAQSAVGRSVRGFVHFPLVVRGSEGVVIVEAIDDDGTVVASRNVRLPLVAGGIVARAVARDGTVRVDWDALGDPHPVLVDVFEDHRWVRALSLDHSHRTLALPGSGVWRLQLRADLFSDDTAGVSYVVVAASDGPDRARLAAESALADSDERGLDPLAMAIVDGAFSGSDQDAVRALFAAPSFDVVSVGPGVSSRILHDGDRARAQERRRWLAAGAILSIGFLVSMVLLRIEILAEARARRLLEALGDEAPPRRVPSGRGLWAFVLLVFVLMAVLALSKRWF